MREPDADLEVAAVRGVVPEQDQPVRPTGGGVVADHRRQLAGHVDRAEPARVGHHMGGRVDAHGEGGAQLLLGVGVADASRRSSDPSVALAARTASSIAHSSCRLRV